MHFVPSRCGILTIGTWDSFFQSSCFSGQNEMFSTTKQNQTSYSFSDTFQQSDFKALQWYLFSIIGGSTVSVIPAVASIVISSVVHSGVVVIFIVSIVCIVSTVTTVAIITAAIAIVVIFGIIVVIVIIRIIIILRSVRLCCISGCVIFG